MIYMRLEPLHYLHVGCAKGPLLLGQLHILCQSNCWGWGEGGMADCLELSTGVCLGWTIKRASTRWRGVGARLILSLYERESGFRWPLLKASSPLSMARKVCLIVCFIFVLSLNFLDYKTNLVQACIPFTVTRRASVLPICLDKKGILIFGVLAVVVLFSVLMGILLHLLNVKNNFWCNSLFFQMSKIILGTTVFFSFFTYILEWDSLLLPICFVQYCGWGGVNDDCLSYCFSRNEEVFWPSPTDPLSNLVCYSLRNITFVSCNYCLDFHYVSHWQCWSMNKHFCWM